MNDALPEKLLSVAFPRPWCCPEPRCMPIHNIQVERDKATPGDSFVCFGLMPTPVAFTYDGVEHQNDLNHCDYTPLKGVVRYQETADDWRASQNMYNRALNTLKQIRGTDWPGLREGQR